MFVGSWKSCAQPVTRAAAKRPSHLRSSWFCRNGRCAATLLDPLGRDVNIHRGFLGLRAQVIPKTACRTREPAPECVAVSWSGLGRPGPGRVLVRGAQAHALIAM